MEHGLYLKLEAITNKLANDKGCIVKDPEHYTGKIKESLCPLPIEFGPDKGKEEYYDLMQIMDNYSDFIKKCYTILPRDDLAKLSNGNIKKTGVTMDTLLSNRPCSEEEKERQRFIIHRFFHLSQLACSVRLYN